MSRRHIPGHCYDMVAQLCLHPVVCIIYCMRYTCKPWIHPSVINPFIVPAYGSTYRDFWITYATDLVLLVSTNRRTAICTIKIIIELQKHISFGKLISSNMSKERPMLDIGLRNCTSTHTQELYTHLRHPSAIFLPSRRPKTPQSLYDR
jgi:hypothetical protein